MRFKFFEATRSNFSNKTLVVVDIQPSYENSINFLSEFINFLNKTKFNNVVYFFNGEELGMETKDEVTYWLHENGLKESKIDSILFVDKSYAFFRSAMDLGYDIDEMKLVLKCMKKNKLYDIRDMKDIHWEQLANIIDIDNWKEFAESGDSIYFPSFHENENLMKQLLNKNILLCGGGKDECLQEVAYYFDVIDIQYNLLDEFIY